MIIAIGNDLAEVDRIKAAVDNPRIGGGSAIVCTQKVSKSTARAGGRESTKVTPHVLRRKKRR